METEIKKHIVNLLSTGHKHLEMTAMLECTYCGNRFKKAQKEYNRLYQTYPEKFIYKKTEENNSKIEEMEQLLDDRIKNDSLYYNHLKTLTKSTVTPEEKTREIKRFWNGFYEKHIGDHRRKTIL